jgi:GNAT superfamily N-acetyltransferase
MISAPTPLTAQHQFTDFDSGVPSLDDWLKRRAAKNQANDSSRTYVVCEGQTVIGYYCLSAGAIGHAEAPSAMRRNRPDPIPVMVLGRLAMHKDHQQKGIGTALLRDAILRTIQAAEIAGITALLVHALTEQAKRFYRSRGFMESPIQPMTLYQLLATAQRAWREE